MADTPSSGEESGRAERAERRLVGQALAYWEGLKGSRRMPALADLPLDDPAGQRTTGFWPESFVLELGTPIEDSLVVHAGPALAMVCAETPAPGEAAAEALPASLWTKLADASAAAAANRKALLASGPFVTADDRDGLFRAILMPLGEGDEVRHILGCFTCKPL